jgi:hypothetical protein
MEKRPRAMRKRTRTGGTNDGTDIFSPPIIEIPASSCFFEKGKEDSASVFSRRSVPQSEARIDGSNAPFSWEDLPPHLRGKHSSTDARTWGKKLTAQVD